MNRLLYEKSVKKLNNFLSKYPTEKDLIEKLYLMAIIEAYQWIRENEAVADLLENQIRNKFIRNFKYKNSLLKEYINNYTITLTAENQVYTDDEKHRTDIEFISSYLSNKFVVECKRLTSAETRYIHGKIDNAGKHIIDGLEKFIELVYSEHDKYAGMISFIVKGNPVEILDKLREKVGNFNPAKGMNSLLIAKCIEYQLTFQSKHARKNMSEIQIYHLFFDFVS